MLARLRTGWAVIGDHQRLPGYCVLLHDGTAEHLTDLSMPAQTEFLLDVAALGQAVTAACSALDPGFARINIEILGNADPILHAHVRARYRWEPDHRRRRPVWDYPDLTAPAHALAADHDVLRQAITTALHATGRVEDTSSPPACPAR